MLPTIIGREAEIAVLDEDLDAVARGAGRCLIVEGPVGIGKSRLLKEAAVRAAGRGLVVAAGAATPFDRAVPLRTLLTPLRRTVDGDVRAELDLGGIDDPESHSLWLIETLGEHIERCARTEALLLVIDDVHWADELTALALRVLIPSLTSAPVLWLLSRRTAPADNAGQVVIDWLIGEGHRLIRLGPLSAEASTELCASLLDANPDPTVLALTERCGGDPLLLTELLGALRDSGQVLTAGAIASIPAVSLPGSFIQSVAGQMDDLSDRARRLVMAGAVLGHPFTAQEAGPMVGLPAAELIGAIDEAIRAGVLTGGGSTLAFRNDLVREALGESLVEPVRSVLSEAARATATDSPRPAAEFGDQAKRDGQELCQESSGGTAAGSEVAARIAEELGERCHAEPDPVTQAVRVLASAGRTSEAKRLEYALRTHSAGSLGAGLGRAGEPDARLWLWLARGLTAADRFDEADLVFSLLQRELVRRERGQLGDERSVTLFSCYRGELRMESGLLDGAQIEAEKALWTAERMAEPQICVPPLALLARVAICHGEMGLADEYLRRAAQLAVDGADLGLRDLTWAFALFHEAAGRPAAAIEALSDICGHLSSRLLLFAEKPTAPAELIRLARRTGETSAAETAASAARQLAMRNPEVTSLAAGAAHAEGVLRSEPEALCSAADRYHAAGRPLAEAMALEDAAWIERKAGNADRAAALLRVALDACRNSGARRDVTRIQGRLRSLAGSPASPDLQCCGSPLSSLTDAEMRVVEVIAEGATNREAASRLFLSPHTVDSHLRHVFTKLGINSRVELTRKLLLRSADQVMTEPRRADHRLRGT